MSNSKSKNVKIVKTITTTRKSHPGTTTYCRGGYEEDWWEKSPKTDYTYAKSMSYRASHEPECSSPNMSRHPLHHNGAGLQDIRDEDDEVHISTSQTHHQLTTASSLASSYIAAQTEQERTPRIQDKTSSVTLQDHNSFRASSAHKVQSSIQKSSHRSSAMSTLHVPALHYNSFPLPPSPTGSTSSAVVFPPSATRSGAQYGKSFSIEYNEQGEDVGVMDSSHHEERFAYMESERQIEKALEYAGEPSPRKEKRRLTKRHRIDHDTEEDLETDIMRATSSTTTLSHTALGAHREMLLVRIIKFIVYLLVCVCRWCWQVVSNTYTSIYTAITTRRNHDNGHDYTCTAKNDNSSGVTHTNHTDNSTVTTTTHTTTTYMTSTGDDHDTNGGDTRVTRRSSRHSSSTIANNSKRGTSTSAAVLATATGITGTNATTSSTEYTSTTGATSTIDKHDYTTTVSSDSTTGTGVTETADTMTASVHEKSANADESALGNLLHGSDATNRHLIADSNHVGGFSNTWAYTGSRVHSVLSKLVICDAWLLASTSKFFRHKQCCWLLPLVLLLPLLLIGGICLHERGGLDHVYNYGVALKTDAKDSVQGYSNWLPSLSTGLMWLFGGAHRNNHTAVGADTSRSWWQFLSSPTTRTAKYDTTTIHEGDHITNMEEHTHIHQGLSVDEIQALIRATVQQELAAMSRDRYTSARETELSQQAVNEDDLKAMIKSIVLPLIAKQSEDDRTFVLHNVEQQTHQHYIDLDVKYKENLEKSVVVEREHVMGVIDKAKKDLNTNINADLKQQIEQELKVELERLLGGELQERLMGDLQKKMSTGIGEELREELVKDVRGMLTAHETEVKNKLMILSAGLEEVKQREDVTRHDGTEEKKSAVDMNVLHIDEEKLKSDIQQAILLIMTERQANWQTELQSVHQEMYDKYSSDLKNKMQIQLDKQITDAFAGFVKDHEKQTEEQNTAANRAMLAAVTSSINAALQPAVDKTVAAAVTEAVQQTATQLIQQQLQTATHEAVLLYMTEKEEQQMKEDGETQQSEAQEEGRLVGGAVGMTEEQVGSAIDAALLSYKSDLNDELLAALTKQQTEWQALWLTEQAEKEQQLVVKLGEENNAAVELLVSDWDQDKTTLQDQYAALVEKLNQQQTVIAGLSSGSSDVATSINDIQTAIAALSADTASVNASLIALAASSETTKTEDGSSTGDTIALGAHIDQAAIDALSASLQTLQNDVDELKRVTALYAGNIKECCRNDTALLMFIRTALAELLSGNDNPLGGMFVTPDQLDDRINQILLMLKTLQDQQQSSSGGAGGGFGGVGIGGGMSEQSVRALIKEALLVYGADRTGMVDHALESAGGSVISTRCSETYHRRTAELSLFGIPLWYTSNSPRTVIQPDMQPGQCWAFKGTQGYLVIELASRVHPTAFSLEHIPKSQSPTGRIDSAPRDFSVWGLSHPRDVDGAHLGNFTYDEQGEPLQFFHVKDIHKDAFSIIELRIHSNHGNVEYTCLYRFRVHGTLNS